MAKVYKKFVVANWKMNPLDADSAVKLFSAIREQAVRARETLVVVAPPLLFLNTLTRLGNDKNISFGAQNCFWEEKGAYTGEISPTMIKGMSADYCIVGHSERRALGETNEMVNRKVRAALRNGLTVILCIGESERDAEGTYLEFLERELHEALASVTKKQLSQILIAYEPIWAIGGSAERSCAPRDVHEVVILIHKFLKDIFRVSAALEVPVLYGGSVAPENTEKLVREGRVNGLLVGGQSLIAANFCKIIEIVDSLVF
ncbi:MAG: triosephosphate isomerase [Parcubacteria group bacterium Gr01-1014_48]|nr:MAG: triosephosphate isomerase [Parcubacteria group bacterium Gr01-1014_48]